MLLLCAIMSIKPWDQFSGQWTVPELYHRQPYCSMITLCPLFILQLLSITSMFPCSILYEPHHFNALRVPAHHTQLYPCLGGQQTHVKEPIVSACQNGKRLNYNHLSLDGCGFLSFTHPLNFICFLEHGSCEVGACLPFWLKSASILRNYYGKE